MKAILIIPAICCSLLSQASTLVNIGHEVQQSNEDSIHMNPSIQIITGEQMLNAGLSRLSDLFLLIENGTYTTINGDRYFAQFGATSNYKFQSWIFMVDGVRIDLSRFDAVAVNMTGIALADVDHIEVVTEPCLYYGEFADKGIVHIITKKKNSPSYTGYLGNGNETGDPGPFRYITPTPNVDKVGLNYSHVAGFGNNTWSAGCSYTYQDYFFRDAAIFNRVNTNNPLTSKSSLESVRFGLGYDGGKLRHHMQAYVTEASDYLFDPEKYEILVTGKQYSATSVTSLKTSNKGNLKVSTAILWEDAQSQFKNSPMLPSNTHGVINTSYSHTTCWKSHRVAVEPGFAYRYYRNQLSTTGIHAFYIPSIHTHIIYRNGLSFSGDFQLVSAAGSGYMGSKAAATLRWKSETNRLWSFNICHSYRLIDEEENYFVSAYERGRTNILLRGTRQLSTDISLRSNGHSLFMWKLYTGLKFIDALPFYDVAYLYNNSTVPDIVVGRYSSGQTLNFIGGGTAKLLITPKLNAGMEGLITFQVAGNRELTRSLPVHRFSMLLNYQLPERFNACLRTAYQGAATFDVITPGRSIESKNPHKLIKGFLVCDLSISKRAVHDILSLNLTIRNIFNGLERYHSIGAQFDLRMFFGITVNLTRVTKSRQSQ
ncbi:MAG: hypothetical protein Q8M15_04220 [Bacteroidota bacterium]|nr:hypothetical protein [Bacteroidota bacterium]